MKGFIIYPDYKVDGDRASVLLYGRLENGESFLSIHPYKPYFYIKQEDLASAQEINKAFTHEKVALKNKEGDAVVKIILNVPADVPKLRKEFSATEIESYESDIRFPYRFMMDHNLSGTIDLDGDYISSDRIDRIYKDPDIKPAIDYYPKNIRVLSFDIESGKDDEDDTLYCIGFVCGTTKKVFVNTKNHVEGAVSCVDEETLIENFIKEVHSLDPDVITGWNIIDFDLDYLNKKCKKYKIPFDLGRTPGKIKLTLEENFFRESKADVAGRLVLDGLHLLRVSFIKLPDYKLDTAAHHILGDRKLISTTGTEKYKEIDTLWHSNKKKLIAYNLKDAELVMGILEKSNVLQLTIKRSLLTGMPMDRVDASIASFDSLYIREAHARGYVVQSAKFDVKEERIKGGFVRESEPGIYDYILVLDFKSLYPSIIKTFNIDPLSYVPSGKGKNLIDAPNGAHFKNEDGVLPLIIHRLWSEREKARTRGDELERHAIKILMNSFFGVLASPACRFFNLEIANAITHFGQYILKLTHEKIEQLGYKIIYGDTDSNFVVSHAKNSEEAEKIGKKIEKEINDYYKTFIKKEYKRDSSLELAFDKIFIKFLMPRLRKEEAGAKKRYAGLVLKNGKEEIQFTGLEAVRGDWTDLAKNYQKEIYDRVFHDKDIADYTKKFLLDLKKGKYDDQLVYRKSIRKDLTEYTKSTPPHVKAARQLDKLEGSLIEYVMTEKGPEPIQKKKHPLDYEHYIEKQIKPIAESVLIFFGKNFDELLKGSRQTGLGSY